ncbi:hypothetical protein CK203_100364 [Vitis vinifera]|uniref:Uncharacterized protein n=1 Tax=Vitis vinifera TaxID=29760 RepID=A0A438DL61_VITVI|nr:hypothetical protein CK203_100364 [Vitis vinifera]
MNFMSYVAEVSREWDEPNARDMGRMKSQPNAKCEMYILNDDIDMKAKIAAMARRLEELEMMKMQEVQAISQTPLQAMPCAICLSYEHLVEECPTIPMVREMFGDCNTYNSNWRDHPKFSWKPQPPQYKQLAQAPQQASNLDQAMVNLSKLENDEESETEKEKREEIKGKKKGKSIKKDDYDFNVDEEPQRIVIKEEMMKHMPPLFLQALYGFWMIKIMRNVKRSERRKLGIKRSSKARKEHGLTKFRSKNELLRKWPPATKWFRNRPSSSAKIFAAAK